MGYCSCNERDSYSGSNEFEAYFTTSKIYTQLVRRNFCYNLEMSDIWKNYYDKTKDNPPRELLIKALTYLNSHENALDLGSGALNDSIFLIERGFGKVTAVDKIPVAIDRANKLPIDKFQYEISSFEEFNLSEDKYDLVNAQFALPFMDSDIFSRVFNDISSSLKNGGIFTGQLFGDADEWSSNQEMTFHTKVEAEELLKSFEVLHFEEVEKDSKTALGSQKHWHIFNFIVKKVYIIL